LSRGEQEVKKVDKINAGRTLHLHAFGRLADLYSKITFLQNGGLHRSSQDMNEDDKDMEEEEYDFEYSDEEVEEADVELENAYYAGM